MQIIEFICTAFHHGGVYNSDVENSARWQGLSYHRELLQIYAIENNSPVDALNQYFLMCKEILNITVLKNKTKKMLFTAGDEGKNDEYLFMEKGWEINTQMC